jgi:ACGX-repeat protein
MKDFRFGIKNTGYKKVRTCFLFINLYNKKYRGQERSLNTLMEVMDMALSNLFAWNKKAEEAPASACGTACGASEKPAETPAACGAADKPAEAPAACGSACGAADKPAEAPAACGSACGAGDK